MRNAVFRKSFCAVFPKTAVFGPQASAAPHDKEFCPSGKTPRGGMVMGMDSGGTMEFAPDFFGNDKGCESWVVRNGVSPESFCAVFPKTAVCAPQASAAPHNKEFFPSGKTPRGGMIMGMDSGGTMEPVPDFFGNNKGCESWVVRNGVSPESFCAVFPKTAVCAPQASAAPHNKEFCPSGKTPRDG